MRRLYLTLGLCKIRGYHGARNDNGNNKRKNNGKNNGKNNEKNNGKNKG